MNVYCSAIFTRVECWAKPDQNTFFCAFFKHTDLQATSLAVPIELLLP